MTPVEIGLVTTGVVLVGMSVSWAVDKLTQCKHCIYSDYRNGKLWCYHPFMPSKIGKPCQHWIPRQRFKRIIRKLIQDRRKDRNV